MPLLAATMSAVAPTSSRLLTSAPASISATRNSGERARDRKMQRCEVHGAVFRLDAVGGPPGAVGIGASFDQFERPDFVPIPNRAVQFGVAERQHGRQRETQQKKTH